MHRHHNSCLTCVHDTSHSCLHPLTTNAQLKRQCTTVQSECMWYCDYQDTAGHPSHRAWLVILLPHCAAHRPDSSKTISETLRTSAGDSVPAKPRLRLLRLCCTASGLLSELCFLPNGQGAFCCCSATLTLRTASVCTHMYARYICQAGTCMPVLTIKLNAHAHWDLLTGVSSRYAHMPHTAAPALTMGMSVAAAHDPPWRRRPAALRPAASADNSEVHCWARGWRRRHI